MQHKSNGKKKIWLVLAALCGAVALAALLVVGRNSVVRGQADDLYQELADDTNVQSTGPEINPAELTLAEKEQLLEEKYGIEIPDKQIDFADLQTNVNKDIYSWICVPGTHIDYPVVQHPDEDDYYLMRNLDDSYGYPSSVYSETMTSRDYSDRMTVLYAHDLSNGTMFGDVKEFASREYFDANRYMFVYLPDDIKVYEIVSYFVGTNNHLLKGYDWTDEAFVTFLNESLRADGEEDQALAEYTFDAQDKALVLSTCVRYKPEYRRLLVGVLLDEAW